jgi:excisionase family DNA binding protein
VATNPPRNVEAAFLTVQEAGRRLAVSRSTVYQLMSDGRLPFIRVGRTRRIEVEALRAFAEEQRLEPTGRLTHGRRYAYEIGCRCEACVEAWNARQREAQARRAATVADNPSVRHRTLGAYRNHGCRCDACNRAQSEANRRRPSRAKGAR